MNVLDTPGCHPGYEKIGSDMRFAACTARDQIVRSGMFGVHSMPKYLVGCRCRISTCCFAPTCGHEPSNRWLAGGFRKQALFR